MCLESSGKPDAGKLARPVWGWGRGVTPRPTPRTPVPDQASFRIDFPRWLALHPDRDRRIAEALAVGHGTGEVARKFGVTPGRISSLRQSFSRSWSAFHGEEAPLSPAACATVQR